ncbi:MAG: universal stress protein [Solirubrobacteraceae bacterium]|jgi:nucleotide-binding universal stress UspA family protein
MSTSIATPTLVVGYDGSEASRAALLFAARQAGAGGRVIIVHAYELPAELIGGTHDDQLLSQRGERGAALLREIPLQAEALAGPHYQTELIAGAPAPAIAELARRRHADEIVVGARGRGRVRALLGSVSHELIHIADRPVVVIPVAALASASASE